MVPLRAPTSELPGFVHIMIALSRRPANIGNPSPGAINIEIGDAPPGLIQGEIEGAPAPPFSFLPLPEPVGAGLDAGMMPQANHMLRAFGLPEIPPIQEQVVTAEEQHVATTEEQHVATTEEQLESAQRSPAFADTGPEHGMTRRLHALGLPGQAPHPLWNNPRSTSNAA